MDAGAVAAELDKPLEALRRNPAVAMTTDVDGHPPRALLLRGRATVDIVEGVPQEYLDASVKSASARGAEDFEAQVRALYLNDFETTLPKDVERLISER